MPATSLIRSLVLLFAGALALLPAGAHSRPLAWTTPPGITLVEVSQEQISSQPRVLWLRPGDAEGRTLLVSDADEKGRSKCVDDCATEFPPLLAPEAADALGDWTLVRRLDGQRQWAYHGKPLYTWSKEIIAGEVATNVALAEIANAKIAERPKEGGGLTPPAGWVVVRFAPAEELPRPEEIGVRLVAAAQAVVLTDFEGHTLYMGENTASGRAPECGASGCDPRWLPLAAPGLASGIGDFSVFIGADGSRQWAYLGRPLFRYSGDLLPGDARGTGVDPDRLIAALTTNFMPANVSTGRIEGYGELLTHSGMTLYGGYPYEYRWGGRNLRDTFTNLYAKGKRIGPDACAPDDARCHAQWRPFLAPADAVSSGFWEPIRRRDGALQWAYKGTALYTCSCDARPGDYRGQSTYDYFDPASGEQRAEHAKFIGFTFGGGGIYWSIVKP